MHARSRHFEQSSSRDLIDRRGGVALLRSRARPPVAALWMKSSHRRHLHSASARRGTLYLTTVGVSLIVASIALAAMHAARVDLHEAVVADETKRAQLAAISGMEYMLSILEADSSWRTNFSLGESDITSTTSALLNNAASWNYEFIDDDGNLADDDGDSVRLRIIGYAGDSRCVLETLLMPTGLGLNCLEASLHCEGVLTTSATLTADQMVSSNSYINAAVSGGSIQGDAWSTGTISGTVTGTRSATQTPPRDVPDPESVFEYYVANGTPISYASIPSGTIENCVLSANNNPYGTGTNAQGIYVIDCGGSAPLIRNCRIQGTLVFLNVGSGLVVDQSILMDPAIANFPCLMVNGDVNFAWDRFVTLDESELGVNFNPSHTPYNGVSDADQLDPYPCSITGLVYCTGSLTTTNYCSINGAAVVGGTATNQQPLTLLYDSIHYNSPPPGFADGSSMQVLPGTWKRVAY